MTDGSAFVETAAKQEAFEESIKLKHQFRTLDADDVDFLHSVTQTQRQKSDAVRQETMRQLESFRQQQQRAAESERGLSHPAVLDAAPAPSDVRPWLGAKKRKRRKDDERLKSVKIRGPPSPTAVRPSEAPAVSADPDAPEKALEAAPSEAVVSTRPANQPSGVKPPQTGGLALTAYDSSDDES